MLSYFFSPTPGTEFKFYIPMLAFGIFLLIASIIFAQIHQRKKKNDFAFKRLFKKLSSHLFIFGIIYLTLTGLRYENIPYFSMRLWLYLTVLATFYTVYKYIKTYLREYPKQKQDIASKPQKKQKEDNKYLPNKKRK